jgi:hypothetical protein
MDRFRSAANWVASVVGTLTGLASLAVGVAMVSYVAAGPLLVVDPPLSVGLVGITAVVSGYLLLRRVVERDGATDDTGARETGDAASAYQFDGL